MPFCCCMRVLTTSNGVTTSSASDTPAPSPAPSRAPCDSLPSWGGGGRALRVSGMPRWQLCCFSG